MDPLCFPVVGGSTRRIRDKNGKNVERKKTSPFVSPARRLGELFLQRC